MIYPLVQLFLRLLLLALLVITSALGAGALLPDGGQIAFESNADGDTDVYILDLRTRHLHNLTRTNPHYDGQPAWSPDGRRLAFVSLRNDGLGVEVFMMDASGRNVVQVSPGGSDGHAPAWSPQGDALAYVLGYNLLRLVNSVGSGITRNIASVSQAIMVLGRQQLQRWLQLLLFTLQSGSAYPSPLLLTAATRGKMMELLAARQQRAADFCDEAFMAGILSLIDSLIDKPLPEIVSELGLGERLSSALLRHEGDMGALLLLVESVELADPVRTHSLLDQAGALALSDLTAAELEAMTWANQIAESVTS